MATTMTYGGYSFTPVPLMQIAIENQKTEDGTFLGQLFKITLDGSVTPLPNGTAGYVNVDALQDALIAAMATDGRRFYIACGGSDILDVYPRINNVNFETTSDNWVNRADYTIELEFDHNTTSGTPPYISQASEDWVLEFIDDQQYFNTDLSTVTSQHAGQYYGSDVGPYSLRMTHTLSAVGKSHYSGPTATGTLDKPGWQQARAYVLPRLGTDSTILAASGVMNFDVTAFKYYNHVRSQNINELNGSFSVNESWVVMNTGFAGGLTGVLEDFSVDTKKTVDSDITNVSVNGRVRGLSTIDYGDITGSPGDYTVSESRYTAAVSGWNIIQNRILPRAQFVSQSVTSRILNSGVKSSTIAHNPTQGVITYGYEFDDRPSNCIAGALTESISINDTNPTDVIASLTVLGRTAGPVLQEIGTVTAPTRDVSINAIMSIPSGCSVAALLTNKPTTQVDAILCAFEADLSGTYNQLFLQNDNESWDPKTGSYSRNVSWIYNDCTGLPNTTFCS